MSHERDRNNKQSPLLVKLNRHIMDNNGGSLMDKLKVHIQKSGSLPIEYADEKYDDRDMKSVNSNQI